MGQLAALLRAAADFVFPRICCGCAGRVLEPGKLLCGRCAAEIVPLRVPLCPTCGRPDAAAGSPTCDQCPDSNVFFAAARAATPFGGIAKVLVEKLKYSGCTEYAPVMAERMLAVMSEHFSSIEFDAIVPVPLFAARERERGFNQSRLLAQEIAAARGIRTDSRAVRRIRATRTQTRLSRAERADNIRGAFQAPRPEEVRGRAFLLADDVFTTGATLNECAKVLIEAGAVSVHCLAFARAVYESKRS